MSIVLHTDFAYFMRLPIETLIQTLSDTTKEVAKFGKRK